jgi:membrane-bound lytic murein transglycosylase MltF
MIKKEEFELCKELAPIIKPLAEKYDWRPEIIAAIISRESRFGLILDPDMTGDHGHGHGLTQLDDRSFGGWLANHDWQDPFTNIEMGVKILTDKYNYLNEHGGFDNMNQEEAEQVTIAAYNCGEGNMMRVIRNGEDIDNRTANKNYSSDVLDRAEQFKEIFQG